MKKIENTRFNEVQQFVYVLGSVWAAVFCY